MNIINSISKSLTKGSTVPKIIVPEFLENMMSPLQNISEYNQDEIDVCKGNLLIKCRKWKLENPSGTPSKEVIDSFYHSIQQTEIETLRANLHEEICDQMETLFESIDQCVDELQAEEVPSERYEEELASKLILKNQFTLDVKKSNIPLAKLGVFIRGTYVHAGTVVALFPGKVHLPQFLTNEYVDKNLLPDPEYYLMARMDGTIIDGRTAHQTPYNPYGQAHMVNHPPRFTEPNVLQLLFDFPGDPWGLDEFPKALQQYIPNLYAKKPTLIGTPDRSAVMRTVVLMATKTISPGEELVMDYRLNPDVDVPSWYAQVDEDHSRKRWEKAYY